MGKGQSVSIDKEMSMSLPKNKRCVRKYVAETLIGGLWCRPVSEPVAPANCSVNFHARALSQEVSTRTMFCTLPRSTDSHSSSVQADSHRESRLLSKAEAAVPEATRHDGAGECGVVD